MGRFVNPDNSAFQDVLNSKVYVDQVSNRRNSSPTLEVGVFLLEKDKFDLQNNLVIYPMQLYNKENM